MIRVVGKPVGIVAFGLAWVLLGGAGGIETIFTALTISEGIMPPTINHDAADPECDLDYVPNVMRKASVKLAMTNSFGFGGTNASLILAGYTD